ncbi:DUF1080 domain-containing protein [bacterium]|nr:DUF1080 domain-containing protein [bacterium]
MKRLVSWAILLIVFSTPCFAGSWQYLFNGKNLDGWKTIGSPQWTVDNGCIAVEGTGSEMGWLVTNQKYDDFVFRARFKWSGGNSGIQIRSWMEGNKMIGYQCNLDPGRPTATGSLLEENKRGMLKATTVKAESYFKKGDWNTYEISAIGDRIRVVVNGRLMVDHRDPEGAKSGILALQMAPGQNARMQWANLRILEVKNENNWVSLFDGKTLDGWWTLGDSIWTVEDGTIHGKSDQGGFGWLVSKKEYSDFHFSTRFMMREGNSGIQFRSWVNEKEKMVHGFQADMASNSDWISGHLYDQSERGVLVKPKFDVSKIIDWDGFNTYEITAIGPQVELFINGVKTIEYSDPERKKGIFAFQIHKGNEMETFWKDIRLIQF